MSIIILVPVYRSAKFLNTFLSKLHKLDPLPDKIIFCENNSPDKTLDIIYRLKKLPSSPKRPPVEIIRFWLKENWQKDAITFYDSVAIARQMLLQRARQLNPDYVLYLDADMFINQRDALERIERYPTDLTGGAYLRIYPEGLQLAAYWQQNTPDGKVGFVRKTRADFVPFDTTVSVVGGGYMCINGKLLQDKRIEFYPIQNEGSSEDYSFCVTAKSLGYSIGLDSGIKIGHYLQPAQNRFKFWCVNTPPESPLDKKKRKL